MRVSCIQVQGEALKLQARVSHMILVSVCTYSLKVTVKSVFYIEIYKNVS